LKRWFRHLLCACLLAAALPGGTGIASAPPSPSEAPGPVSVADFLELGMPLSARSLFRTLPATQQGASPLLSVLLRRLAGAGFPEEAISLFEEVRPRLTDTIRPAVVQAAGEVLWEQGDRPSACRMFQEVSGRADPAPEALLYLGRCFASEGKTVGAAALFSSARARGRGKLLAGYAQMAHNDRAGALAAWKQADGETAAGIAARILALSMDDHPVDSARALEEIARRPAAGYPERAAALEALSSLLLRNRDPNGALDAAREGLRETERWSAAAAEAGTWDHSAPGGRTTWNALEALFPYGENGAAFRSEGRRFLARIALADGTLRLHNRLRETVHRLRVAETSLARSRDTVSQAIRRAEEIRGIYRAASERAAAVRERLRQAADNLALAEWGAEIDPETFSSLEVADTRTRYLRDRLGGVKSRYDSKLQKEWSPPLSPADRLMVLTAQIRLDRIERRILALESRMAFIQRAAWNRWKAEFTSRVSALMDRAEKIPPQTAAGAEKAGRIALRLRGILESQTAWIAQMNRARERLAQREILLGNRRADILKDADRARGAALRELSAAISRRKGFLHYLAARSATESLTADPGTAADPSAGAVASRDALRKEAFLHWEAVSASAGGAGVPVDEAIYAMAELKYEEEERLFFESPGKEGGVPDHSGSLARFRRIVQDHPGSPYREQAWYGMALCLQEMGKAEESGGAMRALLTAYPKTRFADELHLRLGEDAFDRYDFDVAAEEYRKVGEDASPDLRVTARFKLGWSLFLREKPAEAADAFLSSLLLSRDARKTGGVAGESLQMMSRSLIEAGTEAEGFLARRRAQEYGPATLLAIQSILDTQTRYLEAAGIADRFARAYPADPGRIEAERAAAEALRKGNRLEESYRRKGSFYRAFGPGSLWQSSPGREAADIARANLASEEGLRTSLFFFHGKSRESPPGDRPYILAGYDAYLSLFPSSAQAGEVAFQRGWLLFEDGRKRESSAAFEAAADRYGGTREETARYMAVQAMKDVTTPADPGSQSEVIRLSRRYEQAFPEGERLPLVLLDRARSHFNRREFREAADAAGRAARRFPAGKERLAALRLSGDSRFETGEFEEAEKEFRAVLAAADDPALAGEMRKWVGFSMFRRAEGLTGEESARLFARVAEEFPGLEIALSARFRSGSAFAEAGKDREAIAAFLSVESLPGAPSLSLDATRRLAVLYERTGDRLPAAGRYERLGEAEGGGEEKRALLLRAADLFSGKDEARRRRILLAVASLPDTPPRTRISCLFFAAESARGENREDEADRLYGQTLAAQAQAPEVSPELAGKAAWFRGEYRFARYRAMSIVPPLETTLRAKQGALEQTSKLFLEAIRLGDVETVSGSLHRLGEGLEDFRNVLLSSPAPKGLSPEEREEYRFLLEEKAAPIEEKAVEAYRRNLRHAVAANLASPWVEKSLGRLRALRPALFAKQWEYAFPVVTIPVFRGIVERSVR